MRSDLVCEGKLFHLGPAVVIRRQSSAGFVWIGDTSRDQYSGVFFGLGVAYDLVEDAEVRTAIAPLVIKIR